MAGVDMGDRCPATIQGPSRVGIDRETLSENFPATLGKLADEERDSLKTQHLPVMNGGC